MVSSNSKPGMGLFQLLPPELRNYAFSCLGRNALTSLRATCSTLERIVPSNIDRVFISANSRNIQVFRAIADSEKHRHNVTEIIWDDARLSEGPEYPVESDLIDYDYEAYDPVTTNGCPRWFTMRCVDGGVGFEKHCPPETSMGLEESWDYYKALLEDQRGIMQSNADIETFKYGLQRFTHLKRVTITPSTHGRIGQPMFRTPMIRSFPPGFDYPLPRPWPYFALDSPNEDVPWVFDENRTNTDDDGLNMSASEHEEYRCKWRGFRVVMRALVECERDHHVTELIIGGREMMTGVNCHVFDQRCQEYDDLVSLLRRPGFRRLDLDLNTFFLERDSVGWKSYRSGLLHEALTQAKDLRHLSLRTTTATDEGDCWLIGLGKDPEKVFPLEIILPFGQWSNLQHFGISNMLVTQSDLISLLVALPQSLRSTELSHLGFAGGSWWGLLNEMRAKLDWRMRLMEERPIVHMAVATLDETCELGFYADLDDAVESFLYGSGMNPFREPSDWLGMEAKCVDSIPRGTVGIQRDFFDPCFSAPYEFISTSER
ncbi:hypothetical protein FSPOR_4895 [Fusarium sporotrichioides]|uniref:F-box domain-containing protein n=1 Tax=Fusarium sporotrichioides TaxID=5514 RepID=A0A395SA05_FUSSP|nr:hypothetical protein FSPOR_4895 [Fusarium sporotrichioides]